MGQNKLNLPAEQLQDLNIAANREWLVTNGLGGYACGTVAGLLSRKYHGLLIAQPSGQNYAERRLLFSKIEETVHYQGQEFKLGVNRWADEQIAPNGHLYLTSFALEGTTPVWTYQLADCILQKRIWMKEGENSTYIAYYLPQASAELELNLECFVNDRNHHLVQKELLDLETEELKQGLLVKASLPFYLFAPDSTSQMIEPNWYRDYKLNQEQKRGYEFLDNHCKIAEFKYKVAPSKLVTFIASTEANVNLSGVEAYQAKIDGQIAFLDQHWTDRYQTPGWIKQLALAARQFIVQKRRSGQNKSVIAGYPWFDDWSRDTLISLPGLADLPVSKQILLDYIETMKDGLLPTQLNEPFKYDNMDGALWYFQALHHYLQESKDLDLLREIFIKLIRIIDFYLEGTKFNIQADSTDYLLKSNCPELALTWMDANCEGKVFTPRVGKAVEINALWYNALLLMSGWAEWLQVPSQQAHYAELAQKVRYSFQRFWHSSGKYLYDVIDSPEAWPNESIRPNQILAISLPYSPLTQIQQEKVLEVCENTLLTPFGLRTLAPADTFYQGNYHQNSLFLRDQAYHQGTVWPWLLGHFIIAHCKTFKDKDKALSYFASCEEALNSLCLGTLPEVFDGNSPHRPGGCIAQAWSVTEILRAYKFVLDF